MIVILKPDASEEKIRQLCSHFEAMGLSILHLPLHRHKGVDSILFLIDDEVELSEKGNALAPKMRTSEKCGKIRPTQKEAAKDGTQE